MPKHLPARYSEIGCRIPKEYFWVIGWGESDVGIETGSYDAALHMAGIENYNVMLYTSVLPPEALELSQLPDIHHGSVLEGIIAVQHTDKPGTRITVGLLLAKFYRNSDNSCLGGFACEYAGNGMPTRMVPNALPGVYVRTTDFSNLEFVQPCLITPRKKLLHRFP
jgi:arginine decarboxylase